MWILSHAGLFKIYWLLLLKIIILRGCVSTVCTIRYKFTLDFEKWKNLPWNISVTLVVTVKKYNFSRIFNFAKVLYECGYWKSFSPGGGPGRIRTVQQTGKLAIEPRRTLFTDALVWEFHTKLRARFTQYKNSPLVVYNILYRIRAWHLWQRNNWASNTFQTPPNIPCL